MSVDTLTADQDIPIDPALYAIEQIVNDARKHKARQDGEDETRRAVAQVPDHDGHDDSRGGGDGQVGEGEGSGIGLLDEEFDPALREIVNSLTNAQQVCCTQLG
jgi:hypothetical protein